MGTCGSIEVAAIGSTSGLRLNLHLILAGHHQGAERWLGATRLLFGEGSHLRRPSIQWMFLADSRDLDLVAVFLADPAGPFLELGPIPFEAMIRVP